MSDARDRPPPPSLGAVRPGQAPGAPLNSRQAPPLPRTGPPPLQAGAPPRPMPSPPPGYWAPPRSRSGPPPPQRREPGFTSPQPQPEFDDGPPQRRVRPLRVLLLSIVGFVAIAVIGLGFLLIAPPTSMVRDRLIAEVKQKTGRDLVIKGSVRLSLIPNVAVTMNDVTLSAPPTMPGPPLITADQLDLQLELLPLITREVVVERLILKRPVIDLRLDAQGRRSWDFAETEDLRRPDAMRFAQVNPRGPDGKPVPKELQDFARNSTNPASAKGKLSGINDISFGVVRVIDGTVRYADARGPAPIVVAGIDGHLSLKELAGPLITAGQFMHGSEKVAVDVRLESLKGLLEEQPTKIVLKVAAKPVAATYDGLVVSGAAPSLDGRMSLKSDSLDALARFLQVPIVGLDPLGAMALEGQVKFSGHSVGLAAMTAAIGETSATGSLSVVSGGARPQVKANLKFAALDLNRFLALEPRLSLHAAPPPVPVTPAVPARPDPQSQALPKAGRFAPPVGTPLGPKAGSIEDLLARPEGAGGATTKSGPAVRGFTKRSSDGWSSDPLNPAPLRLIDLDGRFEFDRIAWANVKLGATQAAVQLKAGILKLDIPQVDLFGGRGKALITIDAREPELTVGANVSGDGVAALALMQAISDVDFLDGRGRLVLAVSAKGGSERELIGTLNGKADLKLVDGALLGWDASQMIGGLGAGRIPKLDRAPGAKTPFSELSGTFQIANGVARNQDMKVESPVVRASGSGLINLVDRNINMLIKPQAAVGGVPGIEVPLRIAGPLDKVSVVPDLGGALKSPQAQEAVKKLKDGDIEGAARDVLGGGPKADEKFGKAKDLLRQFLNR